MNDPFMDLKCMADFVVSGGKLLRNPHRVDHRGGVVCSGPEVRLCGIPPPACVDDDVQAFRHRHRQGSRPRRSGLGNVKAPIMFMRLQVPKARLSGGPQATPLF